jgi:hypothetical protein
MRATGDETVWILMMTLCATDACPEKYPPSRHVLGESHLQQDCERTAAKFQREEDIERAGERRMKVYECLEWTIDPSDDPPPTIRLAPNPAPPFLYD